MTIVQVISTITTVIFLAIVGYGVYLLQQQNVLSRQLQADLSRALLDIITRSQHSNEVNSTTLQKLADLIIQLHTPELEVQGAASMTGSGVSTTTTTTTVRSVVGTPPAPVDQPLGALEETQEGETPVTPVPEVAQEATEPPTEETTAATPVGEVDGSDLC